MQPDEIDKPSKPVTPIRLDTGDEYTKDIPGVTMPEPSQQA